MIGANIDKPAGFARVPALIPLVRENGISIELHAADARFVGAGGLHGREAMTPAEVMERIQRLLLSPAAEWDRIDEEGADVAGIYQAYILPLAAISVLATFIGLSIVGADGYREPFFGGLIQAVVFLAAMCAGVYAIALIINALAPQFGATDEFGQAFKVAAFFPTIGWVGSIFLVYPALWLVALIGWLYSLYLLYVGLPKLMKPAADKSMTYVLTVIGSSAVVFILVFLVRRAI